MLPTEVATAAIVLMLLKDMVGQLLKEMFLDLGPTFIKGRGVILDSFKTRWSLRGLDCS